MAAEDIRRPVLDQRTPDNRAETRHAQLPEVLHHALDQGGISMMVHMPRGIIPTHDASGYGFHDNGRLSEAGKDHVGMSMTMVGERLPIRDDLKAKGINEAVVLLPVTETDSEVQRSRMRRNRTQQAEAQPIPHSAVVEGGLDEDAYTLNYTTINTFWGRAAVTHNISIALPESTAREAAEELRNPAVLHAFVDQIAVEQIGIPEDAWRKGGNFPAIRPTYAGWAGQHEGESRVYIDTDQTTFASTKGVDTRLITAAPYTEELPPPAPRQVRAETPAPAIPVESTSEPTLIPEALADKAFGKIIAEFGNKIILETALDEPGKYNVFIIQGKEKNRNIIGLQDVTKEELIIETDDPNEPKFSFLFHATATDGQQVSYFINSDGETNLNFDAIDHDVSNAPGNEVALSPERSIAIPQGAEIVTTGTTWEKRVPVAQNVDGQIIYGKTIIDPKTGQALETHVPIVHDLTGRVIVPDEQMEYDYRDPDAVDRPEFWEHDPLVARVRAAFTIVRGQIKYWKDSEKRNRPGYSTPKQERDFRISHHVGEAGRDRIIVGESRGYLMAAEPGEHVLAFGSTGSGKSESLVMPNILNRHGNVISTATDKEIYLKTHQWAESQGDVRLFDPFGVTRKEAHQWDPLQHCKTWSDAREFAHDLIVGMQASQETRGGDDYWYQQAEGLLAPLLFVNANNTKSGSMELVNDAIKQLSSPAPNSELRISIKWLNWRDDKLKAIITREEEKGADGDQELLAESRLKLADARSAYKKLKMFRDNLESKTGSDNTHSALTFAENAMAPWEHHEVRAATRKNEIDAESMWGNDDPDNNPSLYLVAPANKQKLLKGVFAAISGAHFRAAVKHNERRALDKEDREDERKRQLAAIQRLPRAERRAAKKALEAETEPRDKPPVLMALDEAGNIAPITDLESKMALARKQGIQFLLIFQDGGQLETIYGHDKRTTIEGNTNGAVLQLWNSKDFDTIGQYSEGIGETVVMEKRVSVAKTARTKSTTRTQDGHSTTTNPGSKTTTTSHERVVRPIVSRAHINRLPKHSALLYARGYPTEINLIPASKHISTMHRYGRNPIGLRPRLVEDRIEEPMTHQVPIEVAAKPVLPAKKPTEAIAAATTSSGGQNVTKELEAAEPRFDQWQSISEQEKAYAETQKEKQKTPLEQAAQALLEGLTLPKTLPNKGTSK